MTDKVSFFKETGHRRTKKPACGHVTLQALGTRVGSLVS
jgi:hypothetical protein